MKTLVISALVLIGIAIASAFKSPLFLVRDQSFKIDQASCVNADQLKKSISVVGQGIFTLDQNALEKKIKEKFDCVRSISIDKKYPSQVEIAVLGRQPSLVLIPYQLEVTSSASSSAIEQIDTSKLEGSKLGGPLLVDEQDQIYAKATDRLNLPNIVVLNQDLTLGKKLGEGIVNNILTILKRVKDLSLVPDKIFLSSNSLLIQSSNPGKLFFSLNSDVNRQLASLQLILQKSTIDSRLMESVDLRFNKPVVVYSAKK